MRSEIGLYGWFPTEGNGRIGQKTEGRASAGRVRSVHLLLQLGGLTLIIEYVCCWPRESLYEAHIDNCSAVVETSVWRIDGGGHAEVSRFWVRSFHFVCVEGGDAGNSPCA